MPHLTDRTGKGHRGKMVSMLRACGNNHLLANICSNSRAFTVILTTTTRPFTDEDARDEAVRSGPLSRAAGDVMGPWGRQEARVSLLTRRPAAASASASAVSPPRAHQSPLGLCSKASTRRPTPVHGGVPCQQRPLTGGELPRRGLHTVRPTNHMHLPKVTFSKHRSLLELPTLQ